MAVGFRGGGRGLFRLCRENTGKFFPSTKKGLPLFGVGDTQKLEVQLLGLFCLCSRATTTRPGNPWGLWPGRRVFREGSCITGVATFPFLTKNEKKKKCVGVWRERIFLSLLKFQSSSFRGLGYRFKHPSAARNWEVS